MKNCTRRSLYLTLLAVLLIALPRTMNAQVNCATFTTAGTPAVLTPTNNWQTVTTQSNRYYEFAATAGCTYTFSHCQGGGSTPVGTDPSLVLSDQTNTILMFNDDGLTCAPGSEIVWVCPTTGTYRIHHEKCCCSQVGTPHFATMAYKAECPCVAGVTFAAPTALCAGQSTVLTINNNSAGSTWQFQQSTDNINFTNISGGTISPWTQGPLVAGTYYFRAIVTCTGVGNTVGADTTASVQVIVNGLPTVIFPPQASPACCNSPAFVLNTATPPGGTYSGMGVTGTGPFTFTPNAVCNTTATITYTYTDGNGCTNTATQPYTVNDTPAVNFPAFSTGYCFSNPGIFPLNMATPAGGTYGDFTTNAFVTSNSLIPAQAPSCGVSHNVSYTYTDINNCTSVAEQPVAIYCNPVLNFPNPGNMCIGAPCVQLNATPAGGTYTDQTFGTDVTSGGLFCPNNAGTHTITYTYTDGNGCTANQSINIIVYNYPTIVQQVNFPTLCENSNNLNLNAINYFLPAGGTYGSSTGGVSGNILNPTGQCANSPKWITYTVSVNGCSSIDSAQIFINCIPTVTFNGPVPPVCAGSAPFMLTGYVTPAGGTFSNGGGFVTSGGQFDPSTAGVYNVTYQYLDLATNCSNSVNFQVTVNAIPNNVNVNPIPDMCLGSDPMILNQGTPNVPAGTYTGIGVTGSGPYYWDPVQSGADTFQVYYTYCNTSGCCALDSGEIIIHPGPQINFPPLADVCDDDALVQLLATPSGIGGVFSSVTTGAVVLVGGNYYFDPSVGPGTYIIRYIYNDGLTTCVDTAYQNIIVKPRPGNITITNLVNPTTCGACNGSFRINGLASNTNYILTYERNSVIQGPYSITSTGLGTYTVTGLCAGTYGNVLVYLNGCAEVTPPNPIQLFDPNAPAAPTVGSNSPLCQFSTLQLTAATGVTNPTFTWTGPNSFFSNQQNPAIVNAGVAASGTYNVTVTNSQNCTSQPASVSVVVNPAPNLSISSNAPVCAGNPLNLQAASTTTGTTFQWTGPSSFFSPVANPTIASVTPSNQGWYYAVATAPNNCTRIDSLLVNVGTVTPITPVAGGNNPVCSGSTLNLTATNTTPGATYNWSGPNTFTSTTQNPSRANMQMVDSGDYYVYASLNGCTSVATSVHISVIQSLSPDITITANPDDTVCFGTNIDFNSVITDGGTNPQYQWYKNGIPVIGAIDSFWGSPYLTDLDTVYAVLINATTCTTSSSDTSNKITVHMAPNTIPTVSVGSYPFAYVAGQSMTFYANVLNAGTNPTFQWYLNGNILTGETNSTYTSSTLTTTDILSVMVTSNAPCAIPDTASDNWNAILNLSVTATGKVIEDMKLYPNPNSGTFVLSGSFHGMTGVKDADIEIVNAVGQVVFRDKALMNNGKIDKQMRISDIAAGAYIIRVHADGQSTQLRFVVTK